MVIPVSEKSLDYAKTIAKQIEDQNYYVDIESSAKTLQKKVTKMFLIQN